MPTVEQVIEFERILSEETEKLLRREFQILGVGVLVFLLKWMIEIFVDTLFNISDNFFTQKLLEWIKLINQLILLIFCHLFYPKLQILILLLNITNFKIFMPLPSLKHQETFLQNSGPSFFFLFHDLTVFNNFMGHKHLILHFQTAFPQER